MGKKAKQKRALERRKEKRNRKAAMQRMYDSWREAGLNTKSKRQAARAKKEGRTKLSVRDPSAKNIGDMTLFPAINLPSQVKMYLLKLAGRKHQYTGKHTQIVKDFIEQHKLVLVKNQIYSALDWTDLQSLSDNQLRRLAA